MVSLNGSGINGILNTASGSKMKITSVPIEDIVRNEQNEYSIEGIDSLAASIHDVGLRQPIEVKRLPDGTYQLIGGERRLTAMKKLLEEGDTRWQMVPCVVSNPPELDLPISDELKELYALTTTFQSTHPVRGGTVIQHAHQHVKVFQSTHPVRGGTLRLQHICNLRQISIHPPREGWDLLQYPASGCFSYFNPPTP